MALLGQIYCSHFGIDPFSMLPKDSKAVWFHQIDGPFSNSAEPALDIEVHHYHHRPAHPLARAVPAWATATERGRLMFGGAYVKGHDDRFDKYLEEILGYPCNLPIALFDRLETSGR